MYLKYFDTDYTTYKEDEILFHGSPRECIKYLYKNWSVDCLEITDLSLQATLIHDLKCIRWAYENSDYPEMPEDFRKTHHYIKEDIKIPVESIAASAWKDIPVNKFIFNRELCW